MLVEVLPFPLPVPLPPPPPPRPVRMGAPRLRVLQDGAQDCSTCRNVDQCWQARGKATLTPEDVVSNLLVCRIKRGIDVNRSTKLFLKLVRPKIRKMAVWVRGCTGIPLEDAMAEMESAAIESLLADYVMGEQAPPLVWLFHERYGAVRHWVVRTVENQRRERDATLSYGSVGTEVGMEVSDLEARLTTLNKTASNNRIHSPPAVVADRPSEPAPIDPVLEERIHRALIAIEDGKTLNAVEYRVMKFCLVNARGNERMTAWLHQRMSQALGIPRKDVSRIYGIACRKLIEAVGLRERYLKERGIAPPKRRTDRNRPLSADEIITALELLRNARGRATILDVAFALGVTDSTLHQLRKRFGDMHSDAIRDSMRKRV